MMKIDCSTCQITLMIEPSANFSVFCPTCHQTLYSESQSGYGAVTPFYFWLGGQIWVTMQQDKSGYYWREEAGDKRQELIQTYTQAIQELSMLLMRKLNETM